MDRAPRKGRGATYNPKVRFESSELDPFDDGWGSLAAVGAEAPPPPTEVRPDASRTVIVRNASPDIPFEQSINPYRGCEHGCIYCYARPSHAYLGLSPGLDFETKIYAKLDAAALLDEQFVAAALAKFEHEKRRGVTLGGVCANFSGLPLDTALGALQTMEYARAEMINRSRRGLAPVLAGEAVLGLVPPRLRRVLGRTVGRVFLGIRLVGTK